MRSELVREGGPRVLALVVAAVLLVTLAGCSVSVHVGSAGPSTPTDAPAVSAIATSAISEAASSTPSSIGSTGSQPFDPSQLDPRVTQQTVRTTIAVTGWSSRVRPPESVTEPIKRALMRQHHYTDALGDYELDHFIPLSIGGSSDLSNLWLEPIGEAKVKDVDEGLARRNVLSSRWTLAQGQQYMRDRWRIHYLQ